MLIKLGIHFTMLPQGTAALQVTIPSLNITFLDSYKFLMDPLAKLPKRFGIGKPKGWFPHSYNRRCNWNQIPEAPPPLSCYIDEKKDDAATRLAKQEWYDTVKKKQPSFSFNDDAISYCLLDVKILREACCKALADMLEYQDELVKGLGEPPTRKKRGGIMPYFHPFTDNATLGAYK